MAQDRAAQRRTNADLVRNRDAADVRPMPANSRPLPQRGAAPLAADAATADRTLPNVVPIQRVDQRQGALPSARFAHPERPMRADVRRSADGRSEVVDDSVRAVPNAGSLRNQRDNSPRPGLSIISAGDAGRARPAMDNRPAAAPYLPQVPRVERGAVDNAGSASMGRRAAAVEQPRMMQRDMRANESTMPQRQLPARAERLESARPPPPQARGPQRMEAAPRAPYQPRQEMPRSPPPRPVAVPAGRQEAAPPRSEGKARRPASRANDQSRRDDQQN
jgi:hypothetical protein